MTKPAETIRNAIAAQYPGAVVNSRGRSHLDFLVGPGQHVFVAQRDLHYPSGVNWLEVDTAWQPDTGAWQYKMLSAQYNAFARNVLNAGDTIQYVDPTTGENVTFQPLSLNWVNQDNSRQQLAQPQAVTATATDEVLSWTNGYGAGRHFRWQASSRKLEKLLILDNASVLPAPTVTGTIWLELEFIIKNSAGVELYLDGVRWARTNNVRVRTANRIEFRQNTTGNVLWRLDTPLAYGSNPTDENNQVNGEFEVRRSGGSYYITMRVPRTWVTAAQFPIYIDPTLDVTPDPTAGIDTTLLQGSPDNNEATTIEVTTRANATLERIGLIKFDLSSIPGDATIDDATLTVYASSNPAGTSTLTWYRILAANSAWTEAGATWNYAVASTTRWAGDTGADGGTDAGCSVSGTDYTATAMGSGVWAAGEGLDAEHVISLNTTEFASMVSANYGMAMRGTQNNNRGFRSSDYTTDTTKRPRLVVNYTEAGGGALAVNKSESVAAAEAAVVQVSDPQSAVSEAVAVSETVKATLVAALAASEAVAVAETVQLLLEALASASDTVIVSEAVSLLLETLVTITDSIAVSETIELLLEALVTVSDDITITEAVQLTLTNLLAVSDNVTVSEALQITLNDLSINVSDAITVAEAASIQIPAAGEFNVSVSESISIAESIRTAPRSFINKSEAVAVTETVSLLLEALLAPSETVTVAEAAAVLLENLLAVSDAVAVSEAVQIVLDDLQAAASEAVSVTENVTVQIPDADAFSLSVSDSIAVTEALTLLLESSLAVSEIVAASEAVSVLLASLLAVSDSVALSETVQVALDDLRVVVSETVSVTETTTVFIAVPGQLNLAVSETVSVSEAISLLKSIDIAVSDSIAVAENTTVELPIALVAAENISVADLPLLAFDVMLVAVSETVTVSESVTASFVLPDFDIAVSDTVLVVDVVTMLFGAVIAAPSGRTLAILLEDRLYAILHEDRIYAVPYKDKIAAINQE